MWNRSTMRWLAAAVAISAAALPGTRLLHMSLGRVGDAEPDPDYDEDVWVDEL